MSLEESASAVAEARASPPITSLLFSLLAFLLAGRQEGHEKVLILRDTEYEQFVSMSPHEQFSSEFHCCHNQLPSEQAHCKVISKRLGNILLDSVSINSTISRRLVLLQYCLAGCFPIASLRLWHLGKLKELQKQALC